MQGGMHRTYRIVLGYCITSSSQFHLILCIQPFKIHPIHLGVLGQMVLGAYRLDTFRLGDLPQPRAKDIGSVGHSWLSGVFHCLMSVPNRCSARNSQGLTCLGKISTPVCLALDVSDYSSLRNFFLKSTTDLYYCGTVWSPRRGPLPRESHVGFFKVYQDPGALSLLLSPLGISRIEVRTKVLLKYISLRCCASVWSRVFKTLLCIEHVLRSTEEFSGFPLVGRIYSGDGLIGADQQKHLPALFYRDKRNGRGEISLKGRSWSWGSRATSAPHISNHLSRAARPILPNRAGQFCQSLSVRLSSQPDCQNCQTEPENCPIAPADPAYVAPLSCLLFCMCFWSFCLSAVFSTRW